MRLWRQVDTLRLRERSRADVRMRTVGATLGDRTMTPDPAPEAQSAEPGTLALVVQMSPYHPNSTLDLQNLAEQWTRYFVDQLEKLADPRGADLFVAVSLTPGTDKAGHEYRSGHYVDLVKKSDEATT